MFDKNRRTDCPSVSDTPLVLFAPADRGKTRVVACSLAARRRGVVPGILLAEAQSLFPSTGNTQVQFERYDPSADRAVLRQLALACRSFGPWVALEETDSPDCLLLDVTGCGYGFGGEKELAVEAVAALRRHGFWAVAAIADTVGAAWAVAHYGANSKFKIQNSKFESYVTIVPPGRHLEALRPLPVAALRLRTDIVALLHEFDIRQIGQLLALRRADLPSRFGPELLRRLDQALGTAGEVLTPERPVEIVDANWPFEPPIADRSILETVIEQLMEELLKRLQPQQLGVQRLLFELTLVDCDPLRFPVELLRPTQSLRHLMDLVRLYLERQSVAAEISSIAVQATRIAPLEFRQGQMFDEDGGANRRRQAAALLERLSSRLGERSVLRPFLRADAQPEFAYRYDSWLANAEGESIFLVPKLCLGTPFFEAPLRVSILGDGSAKQSFECGRSQAELGNEGMGNEGSVFRSAFRVPRSAFLQCRPSEIALVSLIPGQFPLRFDWNGEQYIVSHFWGPERIETGWWRGADIRRDYYLVETTSGERFWLFWSLADESWFLHGIFA